jgi:hypothetical protein
MPVPIRIFFRYSGAANLWAAFRIVQVDHRREAGDFIEPQEIRGADGSFHLPAVGISMTMAEIYARTSRPCLQWSGECRCSARQQDGMESSQGAAMLASGEYPRLHAGMVHQHFD